MDKVKGILNQFIQRVTVVFRYDGISTRISVDCVNLVPMRKSLRYRLLYREYRFEDQKWSGKQKLRFKILHIVQLVACKMQQPKK